MKINAQFINQHVSDSAHGILFVSIYWANIDNMQILASDVEIRDGYSSAYGLLIVGEYEEAAACEGSAYAVFHPLYISGRYFPNSKFHEPVGFSDEMEAALYRAWQANPEGDVEFA
jgi:hypothetical protein